MISKLAHWAIAAADDYGADCTIEVPIDYEELKELDAELRDNPMLANPMLHGFAWNVSRGVPFVLVFMTEGEIAVTVYVLSLPQEG